jgi:glycosyltransferase involved in cell wall biosynthesis
MATYNGEAYLSKQLDSIVKQIGPDDELIISDDHSTDNTVRIIEECADRRIRLIYNDAQQGYTRNFENALKNANGDIIFVSDQDDVWNDNKVAVMKQHLQHHDLVISDATYVNEALEVTRGSHFKLSSMKGGFIRQLLKPCYIGACMAFNRVVLEKLLPFPSKARYCAYDYWITLVGESCYRVKLVDEQLILYRRHGANASPAGGRSPNSFLQKVSIRGYSLGALTWRITAAGLRDALR